MGRLVSSFQNAKSDLEHALALVNRKTNPFPTEGYVENLHMTYLVLGWIEANHSDQKDKAISYLENAITLDPTRFRPYRVLGEIYLQRGDSTLACRYFKLAFRNKGSDEYVLPEICKE
jgi:tetratricopeptide (TPR) repeat protein